MANTPLGNEIDKLRALNKTLYEALLQIASESERCSDYRKTHKNRTVYNINKVDRIARNAIIKSDLAKYEEK